MGGLVAGGDQTVSSVCAVEDIPGAAGGACWLARNSRSPQQQITWGTLQKGGLPYPALSDPGGGSPLKTPALGRIQK